MRSRLVLIAILFTLALCVISTAQQKTPTKVRKVPAPYTEPSAPMQMYKAYCASCHGVDGKGDGPAASALKAPATDLTQLSKKNGGQFPAARVNSVLSGTAELAAHGSENMPIWGPVFRKLGNDNGSHARLRINNLTKYLESMQAK
jgi:mono/diheme cytochrome c family protein